MNISKKTSAWEFVDPNVITGLLIALGICSVTAVGCFVDWLTNHTTLLYVAEDPGVLECLARGFCIGGLLFLILLLVVCIIGLFRTLFDTWKDFLLVVAIIGGIAGYAFVSGKIVCYFIGQSDTLGSVFMFGAVAFVIPILVVCIVAMIISAILTFILYTKSTGLPLTEEELMANGIHNPQELETFLTNNIYNKMIRCRLVCVANVLPAIEETYLTSLKLSGFYENDFISSCPKNVLNVEEAAKRACEKMAYRMEYWLRGGADWKEYHADEGSILGHCDEILVDCLWDNYDPSKEVTREEFEAKLGFKKSNLSRQLSQKHISLGKRSI